MKLLKILQSLIKFILINYFLIAEKFGYLADNYRFGSNARKFRSDRNPLLSSDNMYIFTQ